MKKNNGITGVLRGIVCFLLMFSLLACSACERDFDAAGYTEATLDQMFQGETKGAAKFHKNKSKQDLEDMHDMEVAWFVDNNIISGMPIGEDMRYEFIELCEQIFSIMQYEVQAAEKTGKKEYEVTVRIAPIDIFPRFVEGIREESEEIMQKAKNGEYKGTEEEISISMQLEFINHAYLLLEMYTEEVSYGEKTDITLQLKADKKGKIAIVNEDLDKLIVKILRLDEIQD